MNINHDVEQQFLSLNVTSFFLLKKTQCSSNSREAAELRLLDFKLYPSPDYVRVAADSVLYLTRNHTNST